MRIHCKSAITAISREPYIIWRFVCNDIWDTVIPCLLTFSAAWIYHHRHWQSFPLQFCVAFVYTILYILTFCMANQVYGVAEDKINKPYRPIPQGLISVKGTFQRMVFYNLLFVLVAIPLKVLWLAVGWQLITFLMCRWGFSNHWFTKNPVCITFGTITLLAAMWRIVAVLDVQIWSFIIVLSLWAGLGLPLQDLRDQAGDRLMKRKTLPLAIGDWEARLALCIHFFTLSPVVYLCAILTQINGESVLHNTTAMVIILAEILWHWGIAIRLWLYRTPKGDDHTYHWFVYLFCITIPVVAFI